MKGKGRTEILEYGQMERHAVITGSFAKELDRFVIETLGVPSLDLMERAALQLFHRAEELLQDKGQPVQIFCGTGNNGADGLLCGAMLLEKGYSAVTAFCVGNPEKISWEFSVQKDHFLSAGGKFHLFSGAGNPCSEGEKPCFEGENLCSEGDDLCSDRKSSGRFLGGKQERDPEQEKEGRALVIDAVFGIGLKRKVEGAFLAAVQRMNLLHAKGSYVLSVDIPSGIDADQGKNLCTPYLPVSADETLTFGWAKAGHYLGYGYEHCGKLQVCDIGYPAGVLCRLQEAKEAEQGGTSWQTPQKSLQKTGTAGRDCGGRDCPEAACRGEVLYDTEDAFLTVQDAFQNRDRRANKGTYGKLLILAGSQGMAGAAYFSGLSAYRCGAGMVKYIGTEKNRCILQTLLPEAMYEAYETDGKNSLEEMAGKVQAGIDWADLVLIGPGLSQSQEAKLLLQETLHAFSAQEAQKGQEEQNKQKEQKEQKAQEEQGTPAEKKALIIDADGLNLIAADPKLKKLVPKGAVLTPHVGELARLCGCSPKEAKAELLSKAIQLAGELQVTVVAKDCVTIVAEPGGRLWLNRRGSAALAKAGSGDVLAGFIAGSLAVLRADSEADEAALAAPAAVFLHGRSGALAAKRLGIHSILARDVANGAGEAMNPLTKGEPERSRWM